jgi:F-type H+-transporting ATPase subunit b
MQELLTQLGIDWRLLLSQAANFLILLIVLRLFAYKPLLKLLKERRRKIEEGVQKAEEANLRLEEANISAKARIKKAEEEAMNILRQTEARAKQLEAELLQKAKEKEAEAMRTAELIIRAKAEEEKSALRKEAAAMVKKAIIKAVELEPEKIDDKLIEKAVAASASAKD